MDDPSRQGLEEYAWSLDLSLDEFVALLEGALSTTSAESLED